MSFTFHAANANVRTINVASPPTDFITEYYFNAPGRTKIDKKLQFISKMPGPVLTDSHDTVLMKCSCIGTTDY